VQSGSDDYDVTINSFASARGSLLADLFHDWSDIPYLDLSQPRYNQGAVEAALNGRIYYLVGDVTPTYLAYTYLLLFNKNKAADYNVSDDLYQLVRDGKWTLDRMFSITENLYNDLDGDGKKSEEDFFGFKVQDNSYLGYRITAIMYACETPYIRIEDKEIVNLVFEERCVDLLDKLCNMMKRAKGALLRSSKDVDYFAQGKALFIEAMANNITGATIVGMQDDFGVLPLPKYDEDQQEYHTTVDFTTRSFETLKTVAHKDLVGAAMEALSALSWRDVTPVYAEAVLEYRSTRDPESAEMMRLILDSRVVDFDLIYSAYSGWARGMHNPITDGPGETVSYLTRNLGPLTKEYDELLDYFFRPTE
jgi:hypothetical protein